MEELIQMQAINADERVRKDMGDIDGLCASIREYGIIQPIVISRRATPDSTGRLYDLVAGGRRWTALTKLGFNVLRHGREFVYRDEVSGTDPKIQLRLGSIELEENLKRKDLSWTEIAEGKARLLKIMQAIHGEPKMGPPTRADKAVAAAAPAGSTATVSTGFSIRKLASMLGEDVSNTSRDLKLATAISVAPFLKNAPNRAEALKKVDNIIKQMTQPAGPKPVVQLAYKIIIDCENEIQQKDLLEEFSKRNIKCRALIS